MWFMIQAYLTLENSWHKSVKIYKNSFFAQIISWFLHSIYPKSYAIQKKSLVQIITHTRWLPDDVFSKQLLNSTANSISILIPFIRIEKQNLSLTWTWHSVQKFPFIFHSQFLNLYKQPRISSISFQNKIHLKRMQFKGNK